jgi:hypothetical protein
MILEKDKLVELNKLGEKLRLWFIERGWDTKTDRGPTSYAIAAKKAGKIRVFFAACRALVVICCHEDGKTKVKVRQGSWTENIVSNVGWFAATGGTNLAFSLWSFAVQKQFESYAREALESC